MIVTKKTKKRKAKENPIENYCLQSNSDSIMLHTLSEKTATQLNHKVSALAFDLTENVENSDEKEYNGSVEANINKISEYLMKSPRDTLQSQVSLFRQKTNTVIVSRKWEEKFLHEPGPKERPCVNMLTSTCFGSKIESNGITDTSFCLTEFYTPEEYAVYEKNDSWPTAMQMCVLCCREHAFRQFINTRCSDCTTNTNITHARIGNIVGQVGEYCLESCFVSSPDRYEGVLEPVVIPQITDYKIYLRNGQRCVKQNLPYPEQLASQNFFF